MGGVRSSPTVEQVARRATLAKALLAGCAAVQVFALITAELQVHLLETAMEGQVLQPAQLTSNQQRAMIATVLGIGMVVITGIAFLRWFHGAHQLAERVGRRGVLLHTAREAVISWFIPVFNLWRPMQIMSAVASASDPSDLPPRQIEHEPPSPGYREPARITTTDPPFSAPVPVSLWWGLWIGSGMVGHLGRLAGSDFTQRNDLAAQVQATRLGQLANLVSLAAAIAAILVVHNIDKRQRERRRRRQALRVAKRERAAA